MESETHITVRYAETDQMNIVHHSNYPIWFEAGRTDFFRKIGMPNSEIEENGILLPLSHMECTFKCPAKYEDEIIIKTRIKKMTCVRLEFSYEVLNFKDESVLAIGSTAHAWTDKLLKPLNIQKNLPGLFKLLKEALDQIIV